MFRLVVLLTTLVVITSSASLASRDNLVVPSLDGRIVGGTETDISKHPHQASLRYKGCSNCLFSHRCGASILNSTILLTAAHCVNGISASRLNIVVGTSIRNSNGVTAPVERIIIHQDYYKDVAYENDIAILVLGTPLPLNSFNIKPIELAKEQPKAGQVSIVTGWGTTSEGGYASDKLLEVEVPIVSNKDCETSYGEGKINDSMLCAGSAKGGKDACQGDSGGPLTVNGVLAGIVSWGYGCARPEYPGVYASVPNLRSWIDEVLA